MLNLSDEDAIRASSAVLSELFRNHRQDYIRLILQRQGVAVAEAYAKPLARAGILRSTRDGVLPLLRVFPLKGRFIATDYLVPRRADNAFAIQIDEFANFDLNLEAEDG
ncbi:MAG: hypothetical protein GY835_09710 [bacterium]|nr:hypothetical protein [bacterium]